MAAMRLVTALMALIMTVALAEKVEFGYTLGPSGTICFLENIGEQVNGKSHPTPHHPLTPCLVCSNR